MEGKRIRGQYGCSRQEYIQALQYLRQQMLPRTGDRQTQPHSSYTDSYVSADVQQFQTNCVKLSLVQLRVLQPVLANRAQQHTGHGRHPQHS